MRKVCLIGATVFLLLAGRSPAQAAGLDGTDEVAGRFLGEPARGDAAARIDYTLFAHELVAY
ncbi:MAG: hypothetical protein ACREQ9_08350, partial [Candidatus Binatia bacterium]